MTGNTKVWRAPLAGLASLAMIATMGVAAGTANAAFTLHSEGGKYTVTVDASAQGGKLGAVASKLVALDETGSGAKQADENKSKAVDVVLNNTKDQADATKATIYNVPATADGKDSTAFAGIKAALATDPTYDTYAREFVAWQSAGVAYDLTANSKASALSGDLTLAARYAAKGNTATVTFQNSTLTEPYTLVKGDKLASWQIDNAKVDPNGQQIKGWNTDSAATSAQDLTKLDTTKDQTLYPVYTTTYTVTYFTVANEVATQAGTQKVASGQEFAASLDAGTNTVWATWADAGDKDGKVQDSELTAFDFSKGVTADTKLYQKAVAAKVKVTFEFPSSNDYEKNDAADTAAAATYGTDEVAAGSPVSKPADPTDNTDQARPFLYWTLASNKSAVYALDASKRADAKNQYQYVWTKNVDAATTLVAVFGEATKTAAKVTFDENWQDGKISEVTANADDTVTTPTPAKRDGYTFKGWNAKADGSDAKTYKAGEAAPVIAGSYYAQWKSTTDQTLEEVEVKLDNSKQFYDAKTYDAYSKVYDKYFTAATTTDENGDTVLDSKAGTLKDANKKAEAVKAVKAAQDAIIEKSTAALYRLYNNGNGDHYFTANEVQAGALKTLGWNYEGAPYRVTEERTAKKFRNLGIAVWSVYNPNTGEHLLVQEYEADALAKAGWNKEQIQFYTPQGAKTNVYRVYNPNTAGPAHVYVSKAEGTGLVAQGWRWDFGGKVAYKLS